MPMAAFDTISVAKRLENDFDMPQKQAEGVALVLHENFVGNVATKEDLKTQSRELSGKIGALEDKIEALEEKITMKMTIRLGGLIIGIFVFFETLNRIFPIGVVSP